ncbi:sensor histidine kinase [Carboxylicivirga linearis]|uniref:histidine kinase n=1 Tax=Carboxylicivirga linearis TaxID=1628157 RepID=A0ABS5JSH9_9BACT|nr:histidine kinase [Carboxylicivirga linearis]MBS2097863.1 sensor histidine kinase [Carboxylicivirga linearis]
MVILIALCISVLLQFGAFFITISLIPKTKFNVAWISISAGFLLMAFRRLNDLLELITSEEPNTWMSLNSWIAIVISLTMLLASFYIRKLFDFINQVENIRKDNETKVLSAILQTEEKERKHFSKELHDGLGPILSSIKMLLSALNIESIDNENKEILQRTEKTVDHAILTTKEISNYLNPQVLERFGLKKALKTFTDGIEATKKLRIKTNINLPDSTIDYNITLILYRVYCELITNTIKHAEANEASITILHFNDKITAVYEDNGTGFVIKNSTAKGSGILNMKSRIKSVNGRFTLSSSPGNGIFVKIEIPQ